MSLEILTVCLHWKAAINFVRFSPCSQKLANLKHTQVSQSLKRLIKMHVRDFKFLFFFNFVFLDFHGSLRTSVENKGATRGLHIYPIFMPRTGCDTRSIFQWSTDILNSDFYFSKTKESGQLYYLPIAKERRLHSFSLDISKKWNADNFEQDLNSGTRSHFLRK